MKNLKNLMVEFAILGMEADPLEAENGLEFPPEGAMGGPINAALSAVPPEDEYELDAEGNPVLDADGNPIKKITPAVDSACACDHADGDMAPAAPIAGAPLAPMGAAPVASTMGVSKEPPEDEFNFNI